MPRHTPALAAAMLVALALPIVTAANAQLPPSKYDKLQRTLEDKFAPKVAKPAPSQARSFGGGDGGKADDFLYIDPKKTQTPAPPPSAKRSDASSWGQSLYALITSSLGGPASAPGAASKVALAEEAGAADPAEAMPRPRRERSERRKWRARPSGSERAERRQRVPVAKPNSFVIQLSPDASAKEIEALLRKYNLTITKMIAPLGVITVEVANGPPRGQQQAPAAGTTPEAQLKSVLEPPIIKELRDEKVVDGAFVNSTMEAKGLPKKNAGATITVGDEVFAWRWNGGDSLDGNWGLKAIRMPAAVDRPRPLPQSASRRVAAQDRRHRQRLCGQPGGAVRLDAER